MENEKTEKDIEKIMEEKQENSSSSLAKQNETTPIETSAEPKIEVQTSEEKKVENTTPVENKEHQESSTKKEIHSTESVKKVVFCISLAFSILLAIFLILSTVFALLNRNSNRIISGIYINSINVSGLTKEEAKESIENSLMNHLAQDISLFSGDYETSFSPAQIEASFAIEDAIDYAYAVGRSGNFIQNNYTILFTLLKNITIEPVLNYNVEALDSIVTTIAEKLPDKMIEPSYYIEDSNLIITKGHSGNVVDTEQLEELLVHSIKDTSSPNTSIELPVHHAECQAINLEFIYENVKKDPKDAYYTNNPFVVYPHVDGIDFAISFEEAKQLLQEEKEEYTIPLTTISPKVTTNQIGTEAFPDLLSSFSTKYYESNVNRTTNLRLAANKINGTVLLPGEEFSYNQVVGKRTIQAGYKNAAVFQGGKVVDGLGGGICQISSTLYDAVLLANLEITERTNHGFVTSYLGAGRDATVVYGSLDFKFKNSRKYPIKIVASVSKGIAEFKIFGKKEEIEYDVEIVTKTISTIPFKVRYVEDNTLAQGKTKVLQGGSNGCKVEAYRVLKLNGQTISTTLLSRDTYNAMQKIIAKGTKK